jgi:amino-acid N-acetyltransferase
MEEPTFAPATPDDLTPVRSLLVRCALPADDLGPAHLEHFFVCRLGDRLAGVVGLELLGDVGLLRSLAVAPEFRGRRLGHELWLRARERAVRLRLGDLYLLTTTAEGLFARWGFRPLARSLVPEPVRATPEYGSLCPSTATVMALALSSGADQRVL